MFECQSHPCHLGQPHHCASRYLCASFTGNRLIAITGTPASLSLRNNGTHACASTGLMMRSEIALQRREGATKLNPIAALYDGAIGRVSCHLVEVFLSQLCAFALNSDCLGPAYTL